MQKTILVINSGSSSIKFSLIDRENHSVIISGLAEELGSAASKITFKIDGEKHQEDLNGGDHEFAMARILKELDDRKLRDSIIAVGHRVVHGGEQFKHSQLIDNEVLAGIEAAVPYAPLHNPAHILGIKATKKVLPELPQVAVFDTAFHQTMPEYAYRYAVPTEWYETYGVRRYGAHGTSHRYVSQEAAKQLDIPLEDSGFVVAHLGNGASLTAVLNGESVDTTMGFTPLEGISMGTRSGDIDPAVMPYMMEKLNVDAKEIVNILNKKSGHLGVSGFTSDMRELEEAAAKGDKNAKLAIDIFTHRAAKFIGSLMTSLPRVDAIIFTAGVGENSSTLRKQIVDRLKVFGYELDDDANNDMVRGEQGIISDPASPVVMVINTNEELMIALDTDELTK